MLIDLSSAQASRVMMRRDRASGITDFHKVRRVGRLYRQVDGRSEFAMAQYTFDQAYQHARARLAAIEGLYDPITIGHVDRTGIGPGWRCLEVGAGGGTIARWLADRVGPTGHVTATDLDTRFLTGMDTGCLEIRQHDIRTDELPADHFDIVHARLVLSHIAERDKVLDRLVGACRPGGWIVVEDTFSADALTGYPTSMPVLPAEVAPKIHRLMAALVAVMVSAGYDIHYGHTLDSAMRAAGLDNVDAVTTFTHLTATSPAADVFRLSAIELADRVATLGLLTHAEVEECVRIMNDPGFVTLSTPLMSAWGRRPA
jgi:2-polyprenyl-3-methyl-5-hydroxy-6-metoxy-1,4-benzoquinol methylase